MSVKRDMKDVMKPIVIQIPTDRETVSRIDRLAEQQDRSRLRQAAVMLRRLSIFIEKNPEQAIKLGLTEMQ